MSKRNGIWGKLANLGLVEIKESPDASEDAPEAEVETPVKKVQSITTEVIQEDTEMVKSLDRIAREQLVSAMENSGANLVEELHGMLDTLKDNIQDEPSRFKAALKILGKQGHPVMEIRQDFDKCIGALEAKQRDFDKQLKSQMGDRIGSKQQIVADNNKKISTKQEEILRLQDEVSSLAAQVHEAETGISEERTKLDLAQFRFTEVYKTMRSEVEVYNNKIQQYGEGL